jgi:hypothetical protein
MSPRKRRLSPVEAADLPGQDSWGLLLRDLGLAATHLGLLVLPLLWLAELPPVRALAVGGRVVVKPGRPLTNVLAFYDGHHPAPKSLREAFAGLTPPGN